jgi:hypothetical protein
MNEGRKASITQASIRRRDLLRGAIGGFAVAATNAVPLDQATAAPVSANEKRKARYRANSVEVQNFYRVNRYPGQ